MYLLLGQIVADNVAGFILDLAIRLGSAVLVLAGVAAVIWRWFIRDRWESAVRRAMTSEIEDTDNTENRENTNELAQEVVALSEKIIALDSTVRNGLEARMIRVEEHVEKLVAGQARMEGIMHVMMRQGD